jgi:alpha-mannosidase
MDERIIRMKLDHIKQSAALACWPVEDWQTHTADYLGPGEYHFDGDWMPAPPDGRWPAGKTLFWRSTLDTPDGVSGEQLFLQFEAQGLEGLLSVDGRPYSGIDANHSRVRLPGTGRLELSAEFACLLPALYRPELRGESARLRAVNLLHIDPAVEAAYYDFRLAWETVQASRPGSGDERRRQRLAAALEDALLAVDLTAEPEQYRQELAGARALLNERVAAIGADDGAGRVFLTGHSHIDTAWLWPLRETVRKCARTFSTACRLMERYPDYHFSCSQPQLYEYTCRHYPQLYQEIKRWVMVGQWETTGGMWVESDCNVPSGESLIRQVLHGVRFFREEFGSRPRTCWLPDVFGYPASLPEILAGCGLEAFMTTKLQWQARNPFPHSLFWWEGLDGTRLLAHIPRLKAMYNGTPDPQQLQVAWENFQHKAVYDEVLFPFGFGDGGGGPTEEMLEIAARTGAYPTLPRVRQGVEEAYFDTVKAADPPLPVWDGELYLETHRGTYTTHGEIKRANRKNELLLRDAEVFSFMAQQTARAQQPMGDDGGGAEDFALGAAGLRGAWENLLLLQFHDILPGSAIGEVYAEAAQDHARIAAAACAVRDVALSAMVQDGAAGKRAGLMVFNSLSWTRRDIVAATAPDPGGPLGLIDAQGQAVPAQVVRRRDGEAEIVFVADDVPAMGYTTFCLRAAPGARLEPELYVAWDKSLGSGAAGSAGPGLSVTTPFYRVDLDGDGCITRLYDRQAEREVIPAGRRANELQLFQDGPEEESAWNIHATYAKRAYAWDPGTGVEVVEEGPVRLVVRVTRRYRRSQVAQDIVFYARLPRIDFVTEADWQERQVLLKAAFPAALRTTRATYEVQFGAVERPTHRNTSWDEEKFEVCAQRWADLSETGYGVSLLNDCKYGYDAHENVLRLTLLRGPQHPDPEADRGRHTFTYALLPHAGNWVEGETVRRAAELNVPLVCRPAETVSSSAPASYLSVAGPAVLETVKPADDGDGWILRLYEPHGARGAVILRGGFRSASECNLVEEGARPLAITDGALSFPIGPFEIKALRVRL